MRRDLVIFLAVAAAISAGAAPGRGEPDQAPRAVPHTAAASITARANVIAAEPGRAALAASESLLAGESLLTGAENGVAITGDGLAQITWSRAPSPDGPALLIEFVAN